MSMEGQGPEGQPSEGVATLTDLVGMMDGGEEAADAQEESAEGEEAEESEESEGAEEEQDEAEGEEEAEEATFTIKVDGKEVTLTQSELVELGQKGLDYTNKTMALAEEKRAFEGEREQVKSLQSEVKQYREQAINDLRVLHAFVEDQIGPAPDISLAAQDAHQYLVAKEWHESQRAKLGQLSQALNHVLQQQEAEQANQRKQRQAKVERELIDSLPGWKDAPAEKFNEVADYVASIGLTPEEVGDAALTKGFWQLAHKAREYDRLQSEKAKLKPVQSLPKVAKPGNNNQPPQLAKRQEALKRHKANPSVKSLAELL
jgi:small-conductance mechanosensitive channel